MTQEKLKNCEFQENPFVLTAKFMTMFSSALYEDEMKKQI